MQSYFFAIAYRVPLVVQNGGAGVAGPGGGGARSRGGEGVRPRGVSVSLCVKKSLKNLGSPCPKIFSICVYISYKNWHPASSKIFYNKYRKIYAEVGWQYSTGACYVLCAPATLARPEA